MKACIVALVGSVLCLADGDFARAALVSVPELGIEVAPGFRVSLFADSNFANDIQAMTLDAHGQIVVTGRGYIQTLLDTNGDGQADGTKLFAQTQGGGMGLCFDGTDLWFVGDGFLARYRDSNGDGIADGPPERLLAVQPPEHGGHAIRKGPDGAWYLIGGNDAGFLASHINVPTSPVREPIAGALLRLSSDGRRVDVVAHGFRNPYDFDFDSAGGLFTYDSDVERDYFLPWYTPTRLYHVALAGHHGWQLPGFTRSWNRPDYAADTVAMLAPMGRGSPTGVECYRHTQFPPAYRDGLFVCDWTFGTILFCPLQPADASYQTQPEVFLRPSGTHGFAPTDVCVGPDGSLFVSIGGRKTRGAVYKIEWAGIEGERPVARAPATPARAGVGPILDDVLDAPQPLAAWSRSRWVPLAHQLGAAPFQSAVVNENLSIARRIRAIEILTEHFGGIETARAAVVSRSKFPQVRARVAWSIGRVPCDNVALVLLPLLKDSFSLVRQAALDALIEQGHLVEPPSLLEGIMPVFGDRDRRIRNAAVTIATRLPGIEWGLLWGRLERAGPQARLTGALASLGRGNTADHTTGALRHALMVLETIRNEELLLQALRICIVCLGGYDLKSPSIEGYAGYELAREEPVNEMIAGRIREAIRLFLPSADARVNVEAGRLLAMIGDDAPDSVGTIAGLVRAETSPTSDFHFLTVLSKLGGAWDEELPAKIAARLLDLDRKLNGAQMRTKQTWNARLVEVTQKLVSRDERLSRALVANTNLVSPAHVELTMALAPVQRQHAAHLFARAGVGERFGWSIALADLVARVSPEESRPFFRHHWKNHAARDWIIQELAKSPEELDRERYLDALGSMNTNTIRRALNALTALPRSMEPRQVRPLYRLVERLTRDRSQRTLATAAASSLARSAGEGAPQVEVAYESTESLTEHYEPLLGWFRAQMPSLSEPALTVPSEGPRWIQVLKNVPWESGDPARGAVISSQRGCDACHQDGNAIGPDLRGAVLRLSREDLFAAILWPDREVSAAYRATTFHTRDGQSVSGLVAFESADGILLQTSAFTTVRLAEGDILLREASEQTIMPRGLLDGLQPTDLAGLYAYLQRVPR